MPEESQAGRKYYRIKSEGEGFERNVLERDLGGRIRPQICIVYP